MFKLGLIINPVAGIGGSIAMKGSDNLDLQTALESGAEQKANLRAKQALALIQDYRHQLQIFTVNGEMGGNLANQMDFVSEIVYQTPSEHTSAQDTELAAKALIEKGVDLLLFVGGDGTARNICHIVGDAFPVLGVPAGCKIHSGVYAVTPKAAGRVVEQMINHQLVTLTEADVMDIDEDQFRQGIVKAKRYGEMKVPCELRYIQAVKSGGKESDELVLQDIAADVINNMEDQLYIIGSGSTTAFLMDELGLTNTLLGVDVIQHQQVIANDVTEMQLWQILEQYASTPVKLVITLIGGQGHIFGRGNQQLSPRIIKRIGRENIILIATKTKLQGLNQRPLIADTGDAELDQQLSGFIPVITGYNDQVLYPIASPN